MEKAVAIDSSSPAGNLLFGSFQSGLNRKRKTPSELRGEQLKRKNVNTSLDENTAKTVLLESVVNNGVKNSESVKVPRNIDTRVDEVYPVIKSSERFLLPRSKDKAKDAASSVEMTGNLGNTFVATKIPVDKIISAFRCKVDVSTKSDSLDLKAKDDQGFRKTEKCSQRALRNVVELHLSDEKPSASTKIDMEKALKRLVALDKSFIPNSLNDGKSCDLPSVSAGKIFPEFHISGHKPPLDFTLKTTLRLISSSSVKWCQRVYATPTFFELGQPMSVYASGHSTTPEVLFSKAIHTWAFSGGGTESLLQRQQNWEESFRSLYYMFCKNICSMFYVCTSQFVVLFIYNKSLSKRQTCNAYLSQSTRGLRSMLRKHDVCFTMPFCIADAENCNAVDFSEIEHQNLEQAYQEDSIYGMDNSPKSLLAFFGNTNVHGLYDILFNYRHFLKSSNDNTVPALYAPIPFLYSTVSNPEVIFKEIKRADLNLPASRAPTTFDDSEAALCRLSENPMCYIIEVKDAVLPPWVVCRICAAMSTTDKTSFESFFITEPLSIGLNIALESFCMKKPNEEGNSNSSLLESGDPLGLPEAALAPCLQSAFLRHLKFCNDSYIAQIRSVLGILEQDPAPGDFELSDSSSATFTVFAMSIVVKDLQYFIRFFFLAWEANYDRGMIFGRYYYGVSPDGARVLNKMLESPIFYGGSLRQLAREWIRRVTQVFEAIDCPDEYCIGMMRELLGGEAEDWWDRYAEDRLFRDARRLGRAPTLLDFQTLFHADFCPVNWVRELLYSSRVRVQ